MRHQGEHFDMGLSRGNFLGFRGVNILSKVCGIPCYSERKKLKKIIIIKCTNRYNFAATIPGEAG